MHDHKFALLTPIYGEFYEDIHKMGHFACDVCQKEYSTTKALKHHQKQCHGEESERKCQPCGKIFSSIVSKNRHTDVCPCTSNKLWIPKSEINNKQTPELRHVHVRTKVSEKGAEILSKFERWMSDGGYSSILQTHRRKLTGKSVSTYTYHLRTYFCFVEEGKRNGDTLSYYFSIKVIKDFLEFLDASGYQAKTLSNKLFAINRFLGFLHEELPKLNADGLTEISLSKRKYF